MKVTLIMVTSLDGKITHGDKPGAGSWASPEDQRLFQDQMASHDRIVMGSKTYEAARSIITPDPHKLRVIITRTPQKYAKEQRPGLLFTAKAPAAIVAQSRAEGCKALLLVGGAKTNTRFFDDGLVDDILVTIEPLLFGSGTPFVATLQRAVHLRLVDYKQLNGRGTILLHYLVQPDLN